ncbi:Ferredoxin, partial [Dysosmobacter welbionis]
RMGLQLHHAAVGVMLHIAAQQAAGLRRHPLLRAVLNVGARAVGQHEVRLAGDQNDHVLRDQRLHSRGLRVGPVVQIHLAVGIQVDVRAGQMAVILHAVRQ